MIQHDETAIRYYKGAAQRNEGMVSTKGEGMKRKGSVNRKRRKSCEVREHKGHERS